jgi:hypothetical protein
MNALIRLTVISIDLGNNYSTLIDYFAMNGAPAIPADANPAEWMLEVINYVFKESNFQIL